MPPSLLHTPWCFDPQTLSLHDYPSSVAEEQSRPNLETCLKDIGEYQRRLWANRQQAVLLIFQGLDASGKDSLIRTLATYMDPVGFHAWSFSRPQGAETRHDFLWRVAPLLPAFGEVVAFNRSHHEAVIAERAWPVRAPGHYHWPSRYASIRHFEQHLVQEGTCIIKCWLHLSEQEHHRRLLKRLDKPRKRWKFDPSDVEAWQRRDELLGYAQEAIAATHTEEAPWLIIPADHKPTARALVAQVVAEQLKALAPDYPDENQQVLDRYRELLSR